MSSDTDNESSKLLNNSSDLQMVKCITTVTVSSEAKLGSPNKLFQRAHSKISKGLSVDLWTQRNQNSQLLFSIYNNNLSKVEHFLHAGAEPNSTCRTYKFSALHLAILTSCEEIINLLIEKGARIDAVDKNGWTPLHYAAWQNRAGCMEILLSHLEPQEKEIYVNKRAGETCSIVKEYLKDSLDHTCSSYINEFLIEVETGATALHLSCQYIQHKCVELLLENKADISIKDDRGLTPFEVTGERLGQPGDLVEKNFIKIIKTMSNNDTTPSSTATPNYFSPIHAAVILQSQEGIDLLLKQSKFPLDTLDHYGQTPIHLAIIKQLEEPLEAFLGCIEDVSVFRNAEGITPFQTAVEKQWIQGVGLLLNANANIAEVAADGRTVLHVAATCANVELLEELLELEEAEKILDAQNNLGESPIFCAVTSGSLQCVNALIRKDCDVTIRLNGNINILHRAAEHGNEDILAALLEYIDEHKLQLIDELDSLPYSGMTPLHMAALNDNVDCVEQLLNWQCDYMKRTISTAYAGELAIHLAASRGNDKVVSAFLNHDKELLWVVDDKSRTPLHSASLHAQRNCIEVLLNEGADLSCYYEEETSLDIIYRTISRPTEFLETIFDNAIKIDDKETLITDVNCMININFHILIPKIDTCNQMSILYNILINGRSLEQRKLLLHPLIESLLYLKWNKMSKIFWTLLLLYALFVSLLTVFVVSIFYYNDETRPYLLSNIEVLRFILIASLLIVTIPEVLLIHQKIKQYTMDVDRIIKWSSIILVVVLIWVHPANHGEMWLRHLATISLLTSWIEMMFMLSKVPTWGYYVQMFFKVSQNVIKVMTVFSFLVIGFALAFMIEFQNTEPFTNPFEGFIKTIVMMAAELDYSGLFTGENKENAQVINLTIYVLFLMMGTIVLMNLLVGLAVSDIHNLEIIGKIDRHAQQIMFLNMLESDTLSRFLPNKIKLKLVKNKCVPCHLKLYPSDNKCIVGKIFPCKLKENLVDIAEDNVRRQSDISNIQLSKKMDDIIKMIDELKTQLGNSK